MPIQVTQYLNDLDLVLQLVVADFNILILFLVTFGCKVNIETNQFMYSLYIDAFSWYFELRKRLNMLMSEIFDVILIQLSLAAFNFQHLIMKFFEQPNYFMLKFHLSRNMSIASNFL